VRHHLRQRWTDPFTGAADWQLVDAPPARPGASAAGFAAVRSRSDAARRRSAGAEVELAPDLDARRPKVSDWVFAAAEAAAASAAAPQRDRRDGRTDGR